MLDTGPFLPQPVIIQVPVTRGNVIETSLATGALAPVRSVAVGSQVTGIVTTLHVDFNSIVHKGQVLAELDPSLMRSQLDSAKAAVGQARANMTAQQSTFDYDEKNRVREEELADHALATGQEVEGAESQAKEDRDLLDEDAKAVKIAERNVEQAETNLSYCTIASPIDGVVIARNVDQGETVTASMAAPTIYTLGSDITSLLLMGDMDESDVGNIRPGQTVQFTVAAYPGTTFSGHVVEIRLNPGTANTVVTYQTVVSVSNPDLMLRPGMTATYPSKRGARQVRCACPTRRCVSARAPTSSRRCTKPHRRPLRQPSPSCAWTRHPRSAP
jgi:HlyD family secretion protein